MKYMGSKRSMLENGLGEIILERAKYASRIIDLFCGAGYVSWFVAEHINKPVIATDLQEYATILAKSVIGRTFTLEPEDLETEWLKSMDEELQSDINFNDARAIDRKSADLEILDYVQRARNLCEHSSEVGPVWNAYGGYYFSPMQALKFDYMRKNLPDDEFKRVVCLASLIKAASKCAASPGHTAQPFRPTDTAGPHIKHSWSHDPISICKNELKEICPRHAQSAGDAWIADALELAPNLKQDDLVFVDPPYSNVQYSRFYHVLETIAVGKVEKVSGAGRYPPIDERPQSGFSRKTDSLQSLQILLRGLHRSRANVIFTFPKGKSSNGLSGDMIKSQAKLLFEVEEKIVGGKYSTLGGNNTHRASRMKSEEMILFMKPI